MSAPADDPRRRLRIGELATLAGTTTRTIRHYHAIGLLPEPERDDSGYRRYAAEDLVRLIRVRRLREIDMPLDQVEEHLAEGADDLPAALRSLAADIGRQIDELSQLRERVLALIASSALEAPTEVWRAALQRRGRLPAGTPLPADERLAVELLDALHPDGIQGVITQGAQLATDRSRRAALGPLLQRFRTLPDDAGDRQLEALATEFVALMPAPDQPAAPVDVATMDKLIGDRFAPAQLRCLHMVRRLIEQRDG